MRFPVFLIVLLSLTGCASSAMDAAECRAGNWHAIGYEDGASGKNPQYFGQRRKACAEHGIVADFDAYMTGRQDGLTHFCDPANAYNVGASGQRYDGVCPAEREAAFLAEYHKGYGLYERKVAVDKARRALDSARNRSNSVEHDLADKLARMVKPDLGVTERTNLAVDIKQLTDEKIRLSTDITRLQGEYDQAQRAYDEYRRHTSTARY